MYGYEVAPAAPERVTEGEHLLLENSTACQKLMPDMFGWLPLLLGVVVGRFVMVAVLFAGGRLCRDQHADVPRAFGCVGVMHLWRV